MSTLAELLSWQHIADEWRLAAEEAIYELMKGDIGRRFMFLWS